MMVRILIVDDHDLVREGLRALLERESGFVVVGEAGEAHEAVQKARELRPDVVLLDISMPGGLGGLEVSEILLAEPHPPKVILLTQHEDPAYMRRAMRLGTHGYLLKRSASEQLREAVRTVATGGRYLHPMVASELVEMVARGDTGEADDDYERLTPREKQVYKLLAEGRTSREIGRLLGVSIKTAMTHRAHVMEKLGLHSRAELVKDAVRRRVVEV